MASESEGWHTPQWTWSYPGFLDQHLPHPQAPLTRRVPARWKASYSLPKRWRGPLSLIIESGLPVAGQAVFFSSCFFIRNVWPLPLSPSCPLLSGLTHSKGLWGSREDAEDGLSGEGQPSKVLVQGPNTSGYAPASRSFQRVMSKNPRPQSSPLGMSLRLASPTSHVILSPWHLRKDDISPLPPAHTFSHKSPSAKAAQQLLSRVSAAHAPSVRGSTA